MFTSETQSEPTGCKVYLSRGATLFCLCTNLIFISWMDAIQVIESLYLNYGLLVVHKIRLFMQSCCTAVDISCCIHDTEV